MEPETTEIMPEIARLFIQPTEKPSTTKFDGSSFPKTLLHRREGQVSPLWERAADGKENKPLKSLSKDDEHEDEQLSHQDDEFTSSNETRMAMESIETRKAKERYTTEIKPESERLFVQPTKKPSTTELDDFGLPSSHDSSSSKTLLHRREGQVSPLGWGAAEEKENKPLKSFLKDDEHEDEQLSHQDDESISSNETGRLLIQPTQNPSTTGFEDSYDSRLPSFPKTLFHRREGQAPSLAANREKAADGKGKDRDEQFRMDDELLESDEPLESDDESSTQDGWIGNGDQMANLVLVLRWARSYRVSIEVAGRMLKMKPEIVNRALKVHAQSNDPNSKEEPFVFPAKPVIKHWVKLGPLEDFIAR